MTDDADCVLQCQVLVGEQQVHRSSLEFGKDRCVPSSEQADGCLGGQTASDFTLLFPQAWSCLAHNKLDNSFLNSCFEQTCQFSLCDGAQEVLWSSNGFSEFLWTRSESLCSVLSLTKPQQLQSPQLTLLTFIPYFSVWNVYHEHPRMWPLLSNLAWAPGNVPRGHCHYYWQCRWN